MIPSSSTYKTLQLSTARKPKPRVLVRDYYDITGIRNNNTFNFIGGDTSNSLAVRYIPSENISVKELAFFMRSDGSINENIEVNVVQGSAGSPLTSAISNGTGKIISFSDQSVRWRKAHFPTQFNLTSGENYYFVLSVPGSSYSYYIAQDAYASAGEYQIDIGSDGSYNSTTSGATLCTKLLLDDYSLSGTITQLSAINGSGVIYASGMSAVANEHDRMLLTIESSGASGSPDNKGASFYIINNTVSSFNVDLNPITRGITVGDSFKIESLNNFVEIDSALSYTVNEERDRTINVANFNIFNKDKKYFDPQPLSSLIDQGNQIIGQLAFGDSEYINQFRGYISRKSVTSKSVQVEAQDVAGQFQRFPVNIANISSLAPEKVIQRVCQKKNVPHICDQTGSVTPSGASFNSSLSGLEIMHTIRQSLAWRLYGDQFGRIRFRARKTAGSVDFSLTDSNYILKNGTSVNLDQSNTYNILAATNSEDSLSYDEEVLLSSFSGSAENLNLTINFASAGVYSNIRWLDVTNDGSVFVVENGGLRNTGTVTSGIGSLNFAVNGLVGTPDYDLEIYGSKINNLTSSQFYVEKVDGESLNSINLNTTKKLVQNKYFTNYSVANNFLDKVLLSNGKSIARPLLNARGPATLEVEDSVTVSQDDVDVAVLFNVRAQMKEIRENSFLVNIELEDTTVRTTDVKYDIGLRFDTGVIYDG